MQFATRSSLLVCAALVFALASTANAQIEAETFSINPHAGIHIFDKDQDLDDSGVYGLGLGYSLTEHWGLEGIFDYSNPDVDGASGDVDVFRYGLDGLYHFRPEKRLIPYLAVGAGGITFDPSSGSNDTDVQVNAGGGVKYFFAPQWALRADARYLASFSRTQHNFLGTLGLTYAFGGGDERTEREPAREEPVVAVARPADSDGDGVSDDRDRCANTPAGAETDANGCPVKTDTDGDGIADDADRCADTPGGVAVDAHGCPRDDDGDGTADADDKCPGTPTGASVDARGCWVLEHVRFESGQAALQSSSYETLDETVKVLNANENLRVEIQGHSDNTGSVEFNRALSEQRAKAVADYLVEKGISIDRLSYNGFGPSNPIATNDTPEGRAQNRRVELAPLL